AARGVAALGPRDLVTVQPGKAVPGEPRVVLGVGTGLGVAYLVADGDGYREIPGEAGHAGFAPATYAQSQLWETIFQHQGRVSAEDVVSGMGLVHIFEHVHGRHEEGVDADWLNERAAKGDAASSAALDLFVECLGNVR